MERLKGIVFDFNGTLIDDLEQQRRAWNHTDKMYGITAEMRKNAPDGLCNLDGLKAMFPDKSLEELWTISRIKEAIYRRNLSTDQVELRPGVMELMHLLKENGIPFTIASASIKENIAYFVSHFSLKEVLEPGLIVFDNGTYSDKADMYKRAAERLNLKLEELLIIEDSKEGFSGAKRAKAGKVLLLEHEQNRALADSLDIEDRISGFSGRERERILQLVGLQNESPMEKLESNADASKKCTSEENLSEESNCRNSGYKGNDA